MALVTYVQSYPFVQSW